MALHICPGSLKKTNERTAFSSAQGGGTSADKTDLILQPRGKTLDMVSLEKMKISLHSASVESGEMRGLTNRRENCLRHQGWEIDFRLIWTKPESSEAPLVSSAEK